MGIINMTSLILFGTIIILLGIIIVCFYNKSFEINEGFRRNRNPNPPNEEKLPVYNNGRFIDYGNKVDGWRQKKINNNWWWVRR